jgi:hypothetical protein
MRRSMVILVLSVAAAAATLSAEAAWAQSLLLDVQQTSITFPDSNPDLVPLIVSTPTPVPVRVRVTSNACCAWQLVVAATSNLTAGADTIAINNVTWTSSLGSPWQAGGTLAVAPAQPVASGSGNLVPPQTSNLTFRLNNLWTYAPGNYTATVIFTLTAP